MALGGSIVGGLGDISKLADLRKRLFFVLFALLVFRIATHIPVPGINPLALAQLFEQQRGTILDMFNMFSGGALERFSIVSLGIMPYITASIIMQLMSHAIPTLEQMRKEGESGRRKITAYTRYATVALATFQGIGVSVPCRVRVQSVAISWSLTPARVLYLFRPSAWYPAQCF